MSFFYENGTIGSDWDFFLDSFPSIGCFKLMHSDTEGYIDRNAASILNINKGVISKENLFTLIDEITSSPIENRKNLYEYKTDSRSKLIKFKLCHHQDYIIGFVQEMVDSSTYANTKTIIDSDTDTFTGLYTRKKFILEVRSALKSIVGSAKCCMVVLHINGVERIDSELNYDKTSLCISSVAATLKSYISDSIIIGTKSYKDYFIFFKQMSKDEVNTYLQKINDAVKKTKIIDEFGGTIETRSDGFSTTSGYCWYPTQAATIDMMINYADFALFKAMSSGNLFREFDPDEFVNEQMSYAVSREINTLIEKNSFHYDFQPIVLADTGEVYAYEALMRTERANPLKVLSMARANGRLYDIERLTFENVLSIIKDNKEKFEGKKIFINSIPDAMITPNDFMLLCEKYGDIMSNVVIEYTEEADLDGEKLIEFTDLVRSRGCMVAIDDYGSGYSNSAALVNLAPDFLKIDRSLISGINSSTRKQHFLTGIIEFAQLNGITVLAEGVETFDELCVSIRRGVKLIQGFYTSRPNREPIKEIDVDIISEIKNINYTKPHTMISKTYEIRDSSERKISIAELRLKNYTQIEIYSKRAHIIGGSDEFNTMRIVIADRLATHITFENVLINGSLTSCIELGESSSAVFEFIGNNELNYEGIHIPGSSEAIITGQGRLTINSYHNNGCCIGSAYDTSFGKITIDYNGNIILKSNGDNSIGIGGGITDNKNPINIINGNISIEVTGKTSIGIGSFDSRCDTAISGANTSITINSAGDVAVGIGSVNGFPNISITDASLKAECASAKTAVIGTLAPNIRIKDKCHTDLKSINADIIFRARVGCAIGTVLDFVGSTEISDSNIKMYFEGDDVHGIGYRCAGGNLEIKRCKIEIDSVSSEKSFAVGALEGSCIVTNAIINDVEVTDKNYFLPVKTF